MSLENASYLFNIYVFKLKTPPGLPLLYQNTLHVNIRCWEAGASGSVCRGRFWLEVVLCRGPIRAIQLSTTLLCRLFLFCWWAQFGRKLSTKVMRFLGLLSVCLLSTALATTFFKETFDGKLKEFLRYSIVQTQRKKCWYNLLILTCLMLYL